MLLSCLSCFFIDETERLEAACIKGFTRLWLCQKRSFLEQPISARMFPVKGNTQACILVYLNQKRWSLYLLAWAQRTIWADNRPKKTRCSKNERFWNTLN